MEVQDKLIGKGCGERQRGGVERGRARHPPPLKDLASHKGVGFHWWARESLMELKRESC